MRPRVVAARSLIRLSGLMESLAPMIMKPADLVEFGRQTYARPNTLSEWGCDECVDGGLSDAESRLLELIPARHGRLLVLGVGGGREAIALAQMGFDVTGADFIPEMVEKAQANAAKRGFRIDGLIQNIGDLHLHPESFDIVWLSAGMYSSLPTRARRVGMLRRIHRALKLDGYFLLEFCRGARSYSAKVERIRRAFALLTMGNTTYEPGDMLNNNYDFIHGFSSAEEVRREFAEAGFAVAYLNFREDVFFGEAALRKERSPFNAPPA